MKKSIITTILLLTSLLSFSQGRPQHTIIKVNKVFAIYERFATQSQIKTADSLKRLGFTPVDSYRISGTRTMNVTFIKVIK